MKTNIIDSHHHLWNYNPVEYDWIDENMAVIRRDFLPENLEQEINNAGVECVVSVQARQTMDETRWLLHMASENDFIKGVVGWVDLKAEGIKDELSLLSENRWLKGFRHVVQGEPDPEFILREDFNNGISFLKEFNFVYDILIFWHQLPNTIKFVDKHPGQLFVLDHIAKPNIKGNEISEWSKGIKELARRRNVACKVSGMVTEAGYHNWTESQLRPYFDLILEAFGPSRIMFGSDWPVCLVAVKYGQWLKLCDKFFSKLNDDEQQLIFYENARSIYHLENS